MNLATINQQAKMGWPSKYAPYSEYSISSDKVEWKGYNNFADPTLLMRSVVNRSISGTTDGSKMEGGGMKEIKKFRLKTKNVRDGFNILEGKVDEYFRKNNLDIENRTLLLSLKSLDGKKLFIKNYGKKNL